MVRLTKDQQKALARAYARAPMPETFLQFRRRVQPTFGCDGAVVVQWQGMWLCVERDGYTHT